MSQKHWQLFNSEKYQISVNKISYAQIRSDSKATANCQYSFGKFVSIRADFIYFEDDLADIFVLLTIVLITGVIRIHYG